MDYNLTAIYHKVREGYIGIVEEVPGANSQGETLEEVRRNLREAVELIIDVYLNPPTRYPHRSS